METAPAGTKVMIHPAYNKLGCELLLLELPSMIDDTIDGLATTGPELKALYNIDVNSTPPRLSRGNKEFLGHTEQLSRPLLLVGYNKREQTSYIMCTIRSKIVFDKGPIYHW